MWWDRAKPVAVEKTPDLAVEALSVLFFSRGEAAVLLVLRHPYFWHHSKHCPDHAPECLVQTWASLVHATLNHLLHSSPLRLVAVRYEDLVLNRLPVMRSVFTQLELQPLDAPQTTSQGRRRSLLSLRGNADYSAYLWAFSSHDGGEKSYGARVRACVTVPGPCRRDVGAYRPALLSAFGYDVWTCDGANFTSLDSDLLSSKHEQRLRLWLKEEAPQETGG